MTDTTTTIETVTDAIVSDTATAIVAEITPKNKKLESLANSSRALQAVAHLPRHARLKYLKTHQKNAGVTDFKKELMQLENVMKNNGVGSLTFHSSKLATRDGYQTFLEHTTVRGNLGASALVISFDQSSDSAEPSYDLVALEKAKYERDLKKKLKDDEESKAELAKCGDIEKKRLEEKEKTGTLDLQHQKMLDLLKAGDAEKAEAGDVKTEETKEEIKVESTEEVKQEIPTEETPSELPVPEEPVKKLTKKQRKLIDKQREHGKKMIDSANQMIEKKAGITGANKKHRRFIDDLTAKFKLEEQPKYAFFEAQSDTSKMVIEQAKVHKIIFKNSGIDTHYLILGDLQLKSKVISRIDPNHNAEDMYRDHNDFMERIKAKEAIKTAEIDAKTLELEGDKDMIGIDDSDDDEDSTSSNPIQSK